MFGYSPKHYFNAAKPDWHWKVKSKKEIRGVGSTADFADFSDFAVFLCFFFFLFDAVVS